ncbi:DUF421 domain-containing protein [Altericroceibacterium xinjiangense]|uniref:DUF421 domain-containing protein n=1 Tax=Altericroceibacterium xinjiangense TaxID=762261 RepID=UPI000F7F447F|nr:YetF domain-containing protein [Altericroceibacterium xinjiangense]
MSDVTFFFGGWPPLLRIVVVGTLAYAALVLLLRVSGKRTLAQMNAFDFVVTVALGASFGRILTARQVALAEAVTAFALLLTLQFVMARAQLRWPSLAKAVNTPPTLLLYKGEILQHAMHRQRVKEAELRTAVRGHGIGSLEDVEAVVFESNGKFSVIPKNKVGGGSALKEVSAQEPED